MQTCYTFTIRILLFQAAIRLFIIFCCFFLAQYGQLLFRFQFFSFLQFGSASAFICSSISSMSFFHCYLTEKANVVIVKQTPKKPTIECDNMLSIENTKQINESVEETNSEEENGKKVPTKHVMFVYMYAYIHLLV